MTYTICPCISYSATAVLVAQDLDDTHAVDVFFCGFQGPDRLRKAVKRAFQELMWDERQGFKGNEIYVQSVSRETKGETK